jgi:hypothetical protein
MRKFTLFGRNRGYHWMSKVTGEVHRNICGVIRNLVLRDYRGNLVLNLKWKYSRAGF